jgi:predicted lipid-binding transport protein (Tim44 family)
LGSLLLRYRACLLIDHDTDKKGSPNLKTTKLMAALIVCSLLGAPTVSFAKARGGGGGFSGGSRGSGSAQSFGSRGSRTYDQNGAKPIQQSVTQRPAGTAPQPAAGSPAPTAQSTQPSFLQRNPLMAGLAGGLAGTWIGHMLFGATDSSAKTNNAGEPVGAADGTAEGPNFTGFLLLMLLAGGAFYYFLRVRRTPVPVLSGLSRRGEVSGAVLAGPSPSVLPTATADLEVTPADKAAFQQLLIDIQTAWSQQDLAALRRLVTPEMLAYFSTALAEHASQEVQNHVEEVVLVRAEVREAWTEDMTQYATVGMRWSARDYTVSSAKRRGEPGYLIAGNELTPTETSEVWTFMRCQNGKWLLSAIQQAD